MTDRIPQPVKAALEQASEFELISLDPEHYDPDRPKQFLYRKMLGKTIIREKMTRDRVLAAFDAGVRSCEEEYPDDCWEPRHAISVRHGKQTLYVPICFECQHGIVFVDDKLNLKLTFTTLDSAEPTFDDVLRSAGIPLAPKGSTLKD